MLEDLRLGENDIGTAGCDAIAALLIDPNCNLRDLHLRNNAITTEGATTIANSLVNNNKLQTLFLQRNQFGQSDVIKMSSPISYATHQTSTIHIHLIIHSIGCRWLMKVES